MVSRPTTDCDGRSAGSRSHKITLAKRLAVTLLPELFPASREKTLDAPPITLTRKVSIMGNLSMLLNRRSETLDKYPITFTRRANVILGLKHPSETCENIIGQ